MLEKQLLTVKDVSTILNISKSSVYGYVNSGIIPAIRMPLVAESMATIRNKPTIRFKADVIEKFIGTLH